MADSLQEMASAMKSKKESKAHDQPSTSKIPADPQERAITLAEEDAYFDDDEMYKVFDLFTANPSLGKVYSTIKTSHKRTGFILYHLVRLRRE